LALSDDLPILAICRGIQILNVTAGGTLYQDLTAQVPHVAEHRYFPAHPPGYLAHSVSIVPNTRLEAILLCSESRVNSAHHQAIKEASPDFVVNARSEDGLVEGIEARNRRFVLGIQWHPEHLVPGDARMVRLFEALVSAARA
jgi:putative glutamine amidotransferase